MKKNMKFTGQITFISVSPHGDPEGLVLEDGTFVKVPPHSLVDKNLFEVGAEVEGAGELLVTKPNRVFHHAQVFIARQLASDDSMEKDKKEDLKEQHKADLKKRKDAPSKEISFRGKAVAFGTKPKGEIDRILFADGTSVHVPKDVELLSEEVSIGDEFEIKGESRVYGRLRFVKADSVRAN